MIGIKRPYFNSHNLYLFGIFSLCIGLSLSKPLLGLGQLLMLLGWLVDKNYTQKLKNIFSSPLALGLISFFALTLLGLIYTSNFDYALNDLRRKLPLFILPFVLFSKAFSPKELKLFFIFYIGGVLASSFWSLFVKLGGLGIEINDYRDLSRFNSHIRFGLEICLAIFGASFYSVKTTKYSEKLFWVVTIVWLTLFMFLISLFTGLIVLIGSSVLLVLLYSHKIKIKSLKTILYILPVIAIVFGTMKTRKVYLSFYENNSPIEEKIYTPNGRVYFHDRTIENKENGNYIWRNNSWLELESSWNERSKMPFNGQDLKGQSIKVTLVRFITSKGEYKDKVAVEKLTDLEVKAIENGIANYKLIEMSSLDKRIFDIFWEYDNYKYGDNYNGHSLVMRLEYWKTGIDIFMKNLFFGVGTGDIQVAFDQQYEDNNTRLKPEFRLRAHNQLITIAATFGLVGLIIFCWFLFYPIIKTKAYNNFLYLAFFIIILLSMITEDTLDTQIGITFFAFFNSLFLLNSHALQQEG